MLGDDAARGYADANAHVPGRKISAGGCGALVVWGKVDVKGVHRGKDDTKAYAKEQGHDKEHGFSGRHAARRNETARYRQVRSATPSPPTSVLGA